MAAARPRPESIVVVVPAHNEMDVLPACLSSIDVAAEMVDVPVRVVVVLDDCTDETAACVPDGMESIAVSGRSVGQARKAGFDHGFWDDHTWFATTDADSVVPPNWLSEQLSAAADGWDAFVGTIAVRTWPDWPPEVAAKFSAEYQPAEGHRHVHGANLGMWASVYFGVGGFALIDHDEDVDLVARLRLAGVRIRWSARAPVLTSTRRDGRATGGFADYLVGLLDTGEAS
ncbi:glycosyltransferase family 2 protein [Nocardia sp. 348MFTsu5.1]|uniref:glycosyltransferase n=1 Tax=Nocardia sp. 348MFTsu5.1 TaxID=1172185 RepID=UPI00037126B3|nr:glycosyltransferase [Nocardia sp. 348MFTsu5.1]